MGVVMTKPQKRVVGKNRVRALPAITSVKELERQVSLLFTNVKSFRFALGLPQRIFWPITGVTQSGGSRYEMGEKEKNRRPMPEPVRKLLVAVYILKLDCDTMTSAELFRLFQEIERIKADRTGEHIVVRRDLSASIFPGVS